MSEQTMNQTRETKVFILGAGCSAHCDYPLGVGFATELGKFLGEIPDKCPVIKQSVTDTLKLLVGLPEIETLDQLAKHLEDEVAAWRRQHSDSGIIHDEKGFAEKLSLAQKQIRDAKIATSALFCAKEAQARKMPAFQRYRLFITQIFGGYPWQDAVKEADCHVLTFNYDRLFEIAFLDCFRDFDSEKTFVYGQDVLNSGFNPSGGECSAIDLASNRFCFLKLHGSAGWWGQLKNNQGARRYHFPLPLKPVSLEEIENSIPKERIPPYGWESLITFPHERQASQDHKEANGESSDYPWAQYIDTVWNHAAVLLEAAAEVRVIGYSFNPIDSRHVVKKLLSKVKRERKIVIQSKDIEGVKKNLASYKMLRDRLEFDQTPF